MNIRWARFILLAVILCGLCAGCGPSRKPGANQDNDRPKPTEKK